MKKKIFSSLVNQQSVNLNTYFKHLEELEYNGFTNIQNFKKKKELKRLEKDIDTLYLQQINEFGYKNLKKINDLGVLRSPFVSSLKISKIIFSNKIQKICKDVIKGKFILHVNRAIINSKNIKHPASIWHRDLPYQVPSSHSVQALTFIHFINESNKRNGGVSLIPCSHKWSIIPSEDYLEKNSFIPDIKAGSLLVLNSTLLHSSSKSLTTKSRRALITIFSTPMFKQHINYPNYIDLKNKQNFLRKIKNITELIGRSTSPFQTEKDYRLNKLYKHKKVL